ncbi:MAG TPA: PEGA domain-containing protein [Polyangiales bacterium]|nr:PEGA domain-containing protein [Polyangiales bacterium]
MLLSRRTVAWMLGTWLALPCWLVRAQTPVPLDQGVRDHTVQEARAQHRVGVAAFAEQRYEEAIQAFLSADALHPSPETAFNTARAYEAQGDTSHALSYYREYLRRAPRAADRAQVNVRAESLAKKLAELGIQQVTFAAKPGGVSVLLDAEPIGTTPITLDMRPGPHRAEFRKAGHATAVVEFELPADRALDVVAKLQPEKPAPAPGTEVSPAEAAGAKPAPERSLSPEQVASARRKTSVTRTIGFAALGAGVAALGGAVTLEVMRSRAETEAREATDQVAFSEAMERMRTRQTMARVFASAGGALAAVGGVLLVVASGNSSEHASKRAGSNVAFGCQPFKCHASYSRSF